jgi:hypothetical protein
MRKLLFILIFISSKAIAQSRKLSFDKTFEIEVDPIAYLLNGCSFHAIYSHNHFRYDAGFFGIERPESLSGNKGFKTFTTGFGVKANYVRKKVNGAYVGIDVGYLKNNITEKITNGKDISRSVSFGTHIGYRFFLFPKKSTTLSGIYIHRGLVSAITITMRKQNLPTIRKKASIGLQHSTSVKDFKISEFPQPKVAMPAHTAIA